MRYLALVALLAFLVVPFAVGCQKETPKPATKPEAAKKAETPKAPEAPAAPATPVAPAAPAPETPPAPPVAPVVPPADAPK